MAQEPVVELWEGKSFFWGFVDEGLEHFLPEWVIGVVFSLAVVAQGMVPVQKLIVELVELEIG